MKNPLNHMPKLDLRNMDCMDLMAEFPDKYFELAIVDPPYGIGKFTVDYRYMKSEGKTKNKRLFSDDYNWNDSIPEPKYFEELKRVSQKRIIWGANYYNCFEDGRGAIVWYKAIGGGPAKFSQCEIASISSQQFVDYVHIDWQSGFYRKITEGNQIHPCQKPVKLYRWLLENYAQPGDKILDTHGGSMSIAIACHYMGFDLTLSELDKNYYDAGIKRIKEETRQIAMF